MPTPFDSMLSTEPQGVLNTLEDWQLAEAQRKQMIAEMYARAQAKRAAEQAALKAKWASRKNALEQAASGELQNRRLDAFSVQGDKARPEYNPVQAANTNYTWPDFDRGGANINAAYETEKEAKESRMAALHPYANVQWNLKESAARGKEHSGYADLNLPGAEKSPSYAAKRQALEAFRAKQDARQQEKQAAMARFRDIKSAQRYGTPISEQDALRSRNNAFQGAFNAFAGGNPNPMQAGLLMGPQGMLAHPNAAMGIERLRALGAIGQGLGQAGGFANGDVAQMVLGPLLGTSGSAGVTPQPVPVPGDADLDTIQIVSAVNAIPGVAEARSAMPLDVRSAFDASVQSKNPTAASSILASQGAPEETTTAVVSEMVPEHMRWGVSSATPEGIDYPGASRNEIARAPLAHKIWWAIDNTVNPLAGIPKQLNPDYHGWWPWDLLNPKSYQPRLPERK